MTNDEIALDCQIATDTTNWSKSEIHLGLTATVEAAEYERERLGDLARLDPDSPTCTVRIYEKNLPEDTGLDLLCNVKSVTTDHKVQLVKISLSARATEENIKKVASLGVLSARDAVVTARFFPRQLQLFVDGVTRPEG